MLLNKKMGWESAHTIGLSCKIISLPSSVVLSALTESSIVLVKPVEKDTSNSFSRSLSNGLFSSNYFRARSTASASRILCVLVRYLWSGTYF